MHAMQRGNGRRPEPQSALPSAFTATLNFFRRLLIYRRLSRADSENTCHPRSRSLAIAPALARSRSHWRETRRGCSPRQGCSSECPYLLVFDTTSTSHGTGTTQCVIDSTRRVRITNFGRTECRPRNENSLTCPNK